MKKVGVVAILGLPNAGKSSLFNKVTQNKLSIVTPKAQTTRDKIIGILTDKKNGQIILIDTPGYQPSVSSRKINVFMNDQIDIALKEKPDLIWLVVDLSQKIDIAPILEKIVLSKTPYLIIFNKSDFQKGKSFKNKKNGFFEQHNIKNVPIFDVSTKNGKGIDVLLKETWKNLSVGHALFPEDDLSDRGTRFFVSEIIREKIFLKLRDEIPYSCAVTIEEFDEKDPKIIRIEAVIAVEKEGQKGIVVGKNGVMIKSIGVESRIDIEKLLGKKVYLGLRVKVLKDWSKDPLKMERMGYK